MPKRVKPSRGRTRLGLDVSSQCVGYAVFEDNTLVDYGKFHQRGDGHGEKLRHFYDFLATLYLTYAPDDVIVERPFSGGRQRKAFEVLMQYFAVVRMQHFTATKAEIPEENCMYPRSVKSLLKVRSGKNHDENKRIMVDTMNTRHNLSLRYKPSDPKKRVSDDDIADAIAVVDAWLARTEQVEPHGRRATRPYRHTKRPRKVAASRR